MNIQLENDNLQLRIRPDLGGRIDALKDKSSGREWLYHPRGYNPAASSHVQIGASFDDNWTGGWNEIFPNDASGRFRKFDLVDHGELWSAAWNVVERSEQGVKMSHSCRTVPVDVEKTVFLNRSGGAHLSWIFKNRSDDEIPFLFKMHAALAIDEGDEILMPNCLVEPVDLDFSRMIGRKEKTRYPFAFGLEGREIMINRVPKPSADLREFVYCSRLVDGRCGLRNRVTGQALMMEFDTHQFPFVWLFQSYGGFKGHYALVMEPCTNIPWDLNVATVEGTSAALQPRETREWQLSFNILHV